MFFELVHLSITKKKRNALHNRHERKNYETNNTNRTKAGHATVGQGYMSSVLHLYLIFSKALRFALSTNNFFSNPFDLKERKKLFANPGTVYELVILSVRGVRPSGRFQHC